MDRPKFIPPQTQTTYEIDADDMIEVRSVLLLEDDGPYATILKEYLEAFNYSVTVVRDGVQGLKKVMERDFDLVICDLLMPNLPGDMFYMAVAKVKPHLSSRFIFITGHQNDPNVAQFIRETKALALYKPFEMHVLLETIAATFKGSRGQK